MQRRARPRARLAANALEHGAQMSSFNPAVQRRLKEIAERHAVNRADVLRVYQGALFVFARHGEDHTLVTVWGVTMDELGMSAA